MSNLKPSNFVNWNKRDKDNLCDDMDSVLGEAARKGDSIQHVADVVKALYEQYPGLKEYKEERFRVACPGSTVFGPYMPDTEIDCMPVGYYTQTKAIEDNKEKDNENC